MPAATSTPTAPVVSDNSPKTEIKHDQKAFKRQVEDVSDDLVALRKHLTTALDALFRPDSVDANSLRADILSIKLENDINRHNASARNFNAAIDKHSGQCLAQLKGTNDQDKTYFNREIVGFATHPSDIDIMSGSDAIAFLNALSITHHHTNPAAEASSPARTGKHHHHHKHNSHTNGTANGTSCETVPDDATLARLRRQVRIAYGLTPFHFKPVVINAVDCEDI